MKTRKIAAIIMAVCLILTMTPMTASAVTTTGTATQAELNNFPDIAGHWAAESIKKWAGLGVVKGDSRGFRPNDPITRAEMATFLDNLMDYQVKASNSFSDVDNNAWYADSILKANAAGILTGDNTGHAAPNIRITREQAAVMLARAFGVDENNGNQTSFTDASSISLWARPLVFGMEACKYVGGMGDGSFAPKADITRAQAVTMIDNAVKAYYTAAGTYCEKVAPDKAGANCVALVKTDGITLKDMEVMGDLIIAEGVAEGSFTLDGTTVTGRLIARGGGQNSIHIINGAEVKGEVTVEKADGMIRIVSDGVVIATLEADAEVILEGDFTNVTIDEGASVEIRGKVTNISVEGKAGVTVAKDAQVDSLTVQSAAENAQITISGTVKNIKTEAKNTEITATSTAKITKIEATSTSAGTNIDIDKKAIINTLESNASITTSGAGSAQSTTGTGVITHDETSQTPAEGGGGGGGGGHGDDNAAASLTGATISGAAKINATLKAIPSFSKEGGNASYQWYRSIYSVASDTNAIYSIALDTAVNATYTVTNKDKEKYIYCVLTAAGSTTGGSKYSNVIGPIGDATVPDENVTSLTFTDTDSDRGQIGGTLAWTPPADTSNIREYVAYSSSDGATTVSALGTVAVVTSKIIIPDDTSAVGYIIVFCKNLTGEATSGTSVAVIDLTKAPMPTATFEASNMMLSGVSATMSYSVDGGSVWVPISGTTADMTGASGLGSVNGIKVRNNGGGSVLPSDVQIIALTKAVTPTVTAVNETASRDDGKLAGLIASGVYALSADGGVTWVNKTANSNGEITNLAPGIYQIKISGAGTQLASDTATATVGVYGVKSIATLQSLSGSYTGDSGTAVTLDIEGFTPTTTAYAVTIYDPDIDENEHISLSPTVTAGSGATITQNNGVNLVNDSGAAIVIVTAENGVTTNQYAVTFKVERRSMYICYTVDLKQIVGTAYGDGTEYAFLGKDSKGNNTELDFEDTTVKNGNTTLKENTDYVVYERGWVEIIRLKKEYLDTLQEGAYTIAFNVKTSEGLMLSDHSELYIVPKTATVNYDSDLGGGTLSVYQFTNTGNEMVIGDLIPNGGTASIGGDDTWGAWDNGIYVTMSAISTKRLSSMNITSTYLGKEIYSYDYTKDFLTNTEEDTDVIFNYGGTVEIDAELEDVPKTLPEIMEINLYKAYDYQTGEYSDKITDLTNGIHREDLIYIQVVFQDGRDAFTNIRFYPTGDGDYYYGLNNDLWLADYDDISTGTATITVSGIDKYSTGSASISFNINP